jgi:FkbM family methyltransferase
LSRQAELRSAPRAARLRHLPFRLVLLRLLDAAGLTWPVTAKTFFGRDMQVHLPNLVGVKLYQYGLFEEGLTRALIEKLRPGGSFVDIGAHVGYYTILAALLVGAEGHVVAFEPTPRTRTELSANTAGLDNVQVVPMAALDAAERLTLHDFGWRQSSVNSVVAARVNGSPRSESIEVEAVAVDDWLAAHGIVRPSSRSTPSLPSNACCADCGAPSSSTIRSCRSRSATTTCPACRARPNSSARSSSRDTTPSSIATAHSSSTTWPITTARTT